MSQPQAESAPLQDLTQALSALREQGAEQFDPVGWRFLESLAERCNGHSAAVRALLEQRLTSALADFQARLTQAEAEGLALVTRIETEFPNASDEARRLHAAKDFRGLTQYHIRLRASQRTTSVATLTEALQNAAITETPTENHAPTLEERLRQQEAEALQALGITPVEASRPTGSATNELKALRLVRDTWAKQSNEQRVTQALGNVPADAGPLTSHKLVTRSLATMRDISPAYLNRFVAYVEALLWLEQAGSTPEAPVDKASPGTKTTSTSARSKPKAASSKAKPKTGRTTPD